MRHDLAMSENLALPGAYSDAMARGGEDFGAVRRHRALAVGAGNGHDRQRRLAPMQAAETSCQLLCQNMKERRRDGFQLSWGTNWGITY